MKMRPANQARTGDMEELPSLTLRMILTPSQMTYSATAARAVAAVPARARF